MSLVEDIKTRFATIIENEVLSTASDIKTGSPRSIDNPPAAVVMTLDGTPRPEEETGSETRYIDRNFNILLLVQPWVEGDELEAEAAVSPYIDAYYTAFMGRQALEYPKNQNALDYVIEHKLINDTGVINIRIGGIDWAGIQFTHAVAYVKAVDFA